MTETTEVRSVPTLDLDRYLGQWFEIGRLPLKWEDDNASNVTAHYSLQDDGNVRVDNRCFDNDSNPSQSVGRGAPVEGEPGQLKVSFLPKYLRWMPFTEGDYWVLKIDPDYQVALVGSPDRENLWLLAREWELPAETIQEYLAEARTQGFDLTGWITPVQDGRVVGDDFFANDEPGFDVLPGDPRFPGNPTA